MDKLDHLRRAIYEQKEWKWRVSHALDIIVLLILMSFLVFVFVCVAWVCAMDRWGLQCFDGSGDGLAHLPSHRAVLINHVFFL